MNEILLFLFFLGVASDRGSYLSDDKLIECSAVEYYKGSINRTSVDRLLNRIDECKPKTLVITSDGGDEAAAIDISNALNRHSMNLEIETICLSACAQIVMLGMQSVTIRPLTIVGLHHSAFAIHEWSANHRQSSVEYNSIYEGSASLSNKIHRNLKSEKKLDLLRYAFVFVEPVCISTGDAESNWQWKIWMRRQFWFPKRVDLEDAGLIINGEWESSVKYFDNSKFEKSYVEDIELSKIKFYYPNVLPICYQKK